MRGVADMGMFGSSRPRTMQDMAMQGQNPIAAPQLQTIPMPQMIAQQNAPQMNDGRPHGARRIAGLLSSFASGALGVPDRYGQGVMQQQEQQRQMQLQQQQQTEQRAYAESQWRAHQDYERQNPEPDAFMRSMVAAGIDPNSDEGRRLTRQRVTNMADPMVTMNNGDNTFTLVRPSQLQPQGQPQATPSRPAIGATVADPRRAGGQASLAPANVPPHG